MASTPILPFAAWAAGTNQNSVPANDNSRRNQILNGNVISQAVTAQPGSPAEGDIYIIAATHTGTQWATFTPLDLAIYSGGTWYAFAPVTGVIANVAGTQYRYTGSAWAAIGGAADRSTVSVLTPSAGVVGIDCSLGDYFTLAPTANVTSITFSNLPAAGKAMSLMIRFTQDTTARTVAWPASFKWAAATPGAVSTGSGFKDLIAITSFDQGTTWFATISKAFA
jgi:hypothetical protein